MTVDDLIAFEKSLEEGDIIYLRWLSEDNEQCGVISYVRYLDDENGMPVIYDIINFGKANLISDYILRDFVYDSTNMAPITFYKKLGNYSPKKWIEKNRPDIIENVMKHESPTLNRGVMKYNDLKDGDIVRVNFFDYNTNKREEVISIFYENNVYPKSLNGRGLLDDLYGITVDAGIDYGWGDNSSLIITEYIGNLSFTKFINENYPYLVI
jgi:hypothetical protein